ncbi:MAG: bifunctional ADP-heptose synthase [Candidatus Acidiferrales bacterium]|jgi:rfaE bifunctional protein kinase chain/domain
MTKRRNDQKDEFTSVDLPTLADVVERFRGKKIALLGDFIADEFQFGEISRVSREAPVLILRHRETEVLPGGGANAANNLADLGARVLPVTVVGDDAAGHTLIEYFRKKRVDVSGVVRVRGWTTPVKTRFFAGWPHTRHQQVLRVDRAPKEALPEAAQRQLSRKLRERVGAADVLLVSDYGNGVVTPELVRETTRAKRRRPLLVTLDSRFALTKFTGAGVSAATPNEPELDSLYNTRIGQDIEALGRLARETLEAMKLRSLLVTRGKDGMALFERSGQASMIPVHGSDQAVDVTGAGDTVIAAFTLALACGASDLEAAHISNFAGGIVVMKRGTATVSAAELLQVIRSEATGSVATNP